MTDEKYGACMMSGCIDRARRGYKFCDYHMIAVKNRLAESDNETEESVADTLFW